MCLESVCTALQGHEGEIIVVDNASQEGCAEMIRDRFPQAQLIANKSNTGFSKAVNLGVKQASGEYILILNPDSILPEESLVEVLRYSEKQENLGAVGCRFIDGSGTLLPECKRNFPRVQSAIFKLLGINWGYYADHLDEREAGEVDVLTGAFMFMKRELFEKMNGFDERFFMFGEDIDLSYRINLAGYKNHYCGNVTMIHFKGESSVKDLAYMKHFYGALQIFYLKHYRHHALGRSVLNFLVGLSIKFRTKVFHPGKTTVQQAHSFSYLGEREPVFKALKSVLPGSNPQMAPDEEKAGAVEDELLFFDSANISYSNIINYFDLLPKKIQKRIVSRSGEFYVGSDDPALPGETRLITGGS